MSWHEYGPVPSVLMNGSPPQIATKQGRAAYCSLDGCLYWMPGDNPLGSDTQMLMKTDPSNNNATSMVYTHPHPDPDCPRGDCLTWVWDSNRKKFWMAYGFSFTFDTAARWQASFDPVTKVWADRSPVVLPTGERNGFGVYDPVTDKVIRLSPGGATEVPLQSMRYHSLPNFEQTVFNMPAANLPNAYTDSGGWEGGQEYAIDPVGRVIWLHEPRNGALYRWHIDNHTLEKLPKRNPTIGTYYAINKFPTSETRIDSPAHYTGIYPVDTADQRSNATCGLLAWTGSRVLYPNTMEFTYGRILNMYAYDPAIDQWSRISRPTPPADPLATTQVGIPAGSQTAFHMALKRMYFFGRTRSPNLWYWQEPTGTLRRVTIPLTTGSVAAAQSSDAVWRWEVSLRLGTTDIAVNEYEHRPPTEAKFSHIVPGNYTLVCRAVSFMYKETVGPVFTKPITIG